MPFDPVLANRLETIFEGEEGLTSKKMFGAFCIMIHGNMCCGADKRSPYFTHWPQALRITA